MAAFGAAGRAAAALDPSTRAHHGVIIHCPLILEEPRQGTFVVSGRGGNDGAAN